MYYNRGTRITGVPIRFHLGTGKINWRVVPDELPRHFVGSALEGKAREAIDFNDGWELVRCFLRVKSESEQSVLDFLCAHGSFEAPEGSTTSSTVGWVVAGRDLHREYVFESLTQQEFVKIQDYIRRMLLAGDPTLPPPWAIGRIQRYEIAFARSRFGSEAHVLIRGTFPSILATIQFKLAQGARFKTCARKDCRLPFEVTSRHTRRFCTHYCAHITALRQRRRRERKTTNARSGKRS